ncbi:hypothetical protein PTKIN_Ptkin17bG0144000 [Pterospermum kingtungense]
MEGRTRNQRVQVLMTMKAWFKWALTCMRETKVDTHLKGKTEPASLTKFMEITQKCLADQELNRPSMIEVLCSLELAQKLQFQGLKTQMHQLRTWCYTAAQI